MEKDDTKTTRVDKPKGSWPESGNIYCEKEDCWCGNIDINNGSCKASRCPIHDKEYIQEEEQRKERLQQLHQKELDRKEKEKKDPPAPIRRQTKTREELLQEKISSKNGGRFGSYTVHHCGYWINYNYENIVKKSQKERGRKCSRILP